jgi:hypothetical protein
MHALPSHPKHPLLIGLLALLLALLVMAAAAPDLGTLDFSLGGGGDAASPPAVETAAPAPAGEPTWVGDPLRSPLETLRTGP